MGCTLNLTNQDYDQMKNSFSARAKMEEPLDKTRLEKVRAALHRSASETVLSILGDPNHKAYQSVSRLLAISVGNKMSEEERQRLPEAFRTILKDHPGAMGLFRAAPAHRGPGTSPVQHQYEIFSTAALMKEVYKTATGKTLYIGPGDSVDFGIKFAKDYAQPKRYGTVEADTLVFKSDLLTQRTVAIDAKYSATGNYGVKDKNDLQRQLDGIRTGFKDGKIAEFCFVTNGVFGEGFKEMVKAENLKIARDYAERKNLLYHDEKHGIDKQYLTREEREGIPPGKIPEGFFREDHRRVKEFIDKYKIPQIDMCQHVKFPGT